MNNRFFDPYIIIRDQILGYSKQLVAMIPNLVAAIFLMLFAWWCSRRLSAYVVKFAENRGRPDIGDMLGSIGGIGLLSVAFLIAATIAVPSVRPSDLFTFLGVSSVAVGFAFREILQNLFAGILIIISRPFRRGDFITAGAIEGIVEKIENRATTVRQADGRHVSVPNATLYTSPVVIDRAGQISRDEIVLPIKSTENISKLRAIVVEAIESIAGVESEPKPTLAISSIEADHVKCTIRWFTRKSGPVRSELRSKISTIVYEDVLAKAILTKA